ncbi:MAG TPA: hypothetical protein PKA28_09470 [Methylomusa anaerophila]|uniref:CvpA family protein n=1 Tax=Methylomusa anaerophila TaxID=1930071 RepID=A0A348AI32_9FIRM|nr:hypothetical protein [Methylomusa anaerophila]BBB90730.1 hypothetical protein MAMMFC1_01391 [Methylomusa anaerophila]HML88667.1 hypothetical protein [Methylomusa anaerophila]
MGLVTAFILFNLAYFYLERPVLAFWFTDWSNPLMLWGLFLIWLAVTGIIKHGRGGFGNSILDKLSGKLGGRTPENTNTINITVQKIVKKYKRIALIGIAFIIISLLNSLLLPMLASNPLFFNQAYRNLIGNVQESSFTADVEPIKLSQIRIIDQETAIKLADKKIGEIPALGSATRLGEMDLQKVQDKLFYVAPLEHRGFFQWLSNFSQGSRGYIMVSATDPQDVRLIENVKGHDIYLKYQTNAFLFDYLPRYLYFHGFFNIGMTDYSFEIDDDLNPYWVVTLYKNTIGYNGPDTVGAVLVNAQTGAISQYGMNDVPAWVDRIQPEGFIYKQIRDWGEYINGFWNAIFAKTGILRPAGDHLNLIYGNDNRTYWYTGITSAGRDESTVGFVLVDSRNKEAKWYKLAGATEDAAKRSAEGQVQEKGYRAGDPVLYNINGTATYIASLKDKEGLLKLVSFVSVENYNIVGVGPDIESASRAYQQNLIDKGNLYVPGNETKQVTLQGKVTRFSPVVKGGESYFYFTIENDPRIFIGTVNTSPKIPLVKLGDTVEVTINDSKESPLGILQFNASGY